MLYNLNGLFYQEVLMIFDNSTILLISDSADDRHPLYSLLSENGCNLKIAVSEDVTAGKVKDEIPDCVIIDVLQSERGNILCGMLKSEPQMRNVPFIFIAADDDTVCEAAFKAGFTDGIVRPFRKWEVTTRIKNYVSMSRMHRSLEDVVNVRTDELIKTNSLLTETIDEYKKILKELQDNETLLLTIALNIPNSYLAIIEKDYTIGFAAGQEFKRTSVDPWRLIGLSVEDVYRDMLFVVKQYLDDTFAGNETSFELFFNGQYQFYKTVPLTDCTGEIQRILVVAENITARKEAENGIRESLKEKDILLREIHHRVKNNMQLVVSLLALQADGSDNPDLENIFRTLQSRIFSMSLVHEKLYHYKHFSKINFREYIKDLVGELQKTFNGDTTDGDVVFNLNLDNEYLSIERAIPCGLILNELVVNAFKHAFNDRSGCIINVNFEKYSEGRCALTVSDNGPGLPEGFDIVKSESMGMLLLRELVSQLHGEIKINGDCGAEFRIIFGQEKNESEEESSFKPVPERKSILIVEDERIISTMLKKIILEQNYTISGCVASGKKAIRSALGSPPDLVIMDIVLEDEIDGVEAAKIITGEIDVPVIFLTGNSDAATISEAWNTNPFDILTKPVRKNQLVDVIKSALN